MEGSGRCRRGSWPRRHLFRHKPSRFALRSPGKVQDKFPARQTIRTGLRPTNALTSAHNTAGQKKGCAPHHEGAQPTVAKGSGWRWSERAIRNKASTGQEVSHLLVT